MNRYNSNAFRNGIQYAENAFRFDGSRLGGGAFYSRESKSRSRLHSPRVDCAILTVAQAFFWRTNTGVIGAHGSATIANTAIGVKVIAGDN